MIKVLFVCHGNICRSPIAEYLFRDMVTRAGRASDFHIESAATSAEEIGNGMYPAAQRTLRAHGIDPSGHRARQMCRADYDRWDYIIGMENIHVRRILALTGGDPDGKVSRLLDFTDRPGDIDDPWYTDDFDTAWREIARGCQALYNKIVK